MTKYEWFHKDRQFFFLKEDGKIIYCYRLASERGEGFDKNQWWRIEPVPSDDMVPVPADSEIEYQLFELENEHCPIAGVFMRETCKWHPRRNQWDELTVISFVPEYWLRDPMTVPDDRDFVSSPFLTEAEQLDLGKGKEL